MCNIWQQKGGELSLKQIEEMLSDPLFNSVKTVILTGGEPTLRRDLGEITRLLVENCRSLQRVGITTNGLIPKFVVRSCRSIARTCKDSKVAFGFAVSLDGLGEIHDKVRGVPNAFEKTIESIEMLKTLQKEIMFGLSVHCTVSNANVMGLDDFWKWCNQQDLPFGFSIAEIRKRNLNENNDFLMALEQIELFINFLEVLIKESPSNYYYWMLHGMLKHGQKRQLTCPFAVEAVSVDPNGDVYYCTDSESIGNVLKRSISSIYYDEQNLKYRRWIEQNKCPSCLQDCMYRIALKKNLLKIGFFKLRIMLTDVVAISQKQTF
jgi:MoaA/NifB/PqqE/SkfB family radical SAM enzyme